MSSDFYFLETESFHKKMVQIGKVVSEEIRFEFLYVHDLGQRLGPCCFWCLLVAVFVIVKLRA